MIAMTVSNSISVKARARLLLRMIRSKRRSSRRDMRFDDWFDHIIDHGRRAYHPHFAVAFHGHAEMRRDRSADLAGLAYVGFEAGSAIRQIIDAALRTAGVEMNVVMEFDRTR